MDCARLENSFCSDDKKCTCEEGYVSKNEHCVPAIGTECDYDDCKLDNTRCNDGTCQCDYGFVAFSEVECVRGKLDFFVTSSKFQVPRTEFPVLGTEFLTQRLTIIVSKHGEKCEHDIQCSCKNDGTCNTEDPYTDVLCAGKKCSCIEGYHYEPGKSTCVKSAQSKKIRTKHLGT